MKNRRTPAEIRQLAKERHQREMDRTFTGIRYAVLVSLIIWVLIIAALLLIGSFI